MTKPKSKRNRILLIAAILVVAGLGIWYVMTAKVSPKKSTTATTEEKKTQAETDDLNKNDPTMNQKTSANTTTSSSANQNLAITVSRPVNNDTLPLSETLEIRSVISGATSGTCNLTASGPNGKSVTKSVGVTAQPTYGSCSIDIANSELAVGDWQIAMMVTSGSNTGKTNFKVTLQ